MFGGIALLLAAVLPLQGSTFIGKYWDMLKLAYTVTNKSGKRAKLTSLKGALLVDRGLLLAGLNQRLK